MNRTKASKRWRWAWHLIRWGKEEPNHSLQIELVLWAQGLPNDLLDFILNDCPVCCLGTAVIQGNYIPFSEFPLSPPATYTLLWFFHGKAWLFGNTGILLLCGKSNNQCEKSHGSSMCLLLLETALSLQLDDILSLWSWSPDSKVFTLPCNEGDTTLNSIGDKHF